MGRKYIVLAITVPIVVALDVITKMAILERFRYGESLPIIEGFFDLTYVRNTGAAFGLLAKADPSFRVPFFFIVPTIALVMMWLIFKKLPKAEIKLALALALVIGGAIGNLIDRVRFGYVIDFISVHYKYLYQYPAFNVADSAICVGVGLLLLDLFFNKNSVLEVK